MAARVEKRRLHALAQADGAAAVRRARPAQPSSLLGRLVGTGDDDLVVVRRHGRRRQWLQLSDRAQTWLYSQLL